MAALTMIGGSIGAIAYKDIRQIVSYNVVITVGFILVGLAVSTEIAIQGSIYYLVHDMIVKALLFLLAGTMIYLTEDRKNRRDEWFNSQLPTSRLAIFYHRYCRLLGFRH